MKKLVFFYFLTIFLLDSCTKEVKVNIPGYEQELVIEGRIEPNSPPFVILSTSKDVYAPTNLDVYINSFVSGAKITVSNGTKTVVLDEICTDNLPPGSIDMVASLLGIDPKILSDVNICAYTTFDTAIWGEMGKTYTLKVEHDGKEYNSSTTLEAPVALADLFWKTETQSNYGFVWATLSDPASQHNAYFLEVKRINKNNEGKERDLFFRPIFNPAFNDEFFNGTTFDFAFNNPMTIDDKNVPEQYRGYFRKGDSIVTRFSTIDASAYEFLEKKYAQIYTAGNPFAVPTNIPSNLSGEGALGAWIGYTPTYDTFYIKP